MSSGTKAFLDVARKQSTKLAPNAVKYGYITYYPRKENHRDPVFAPSKLLLVHRVRPFKGNPHWDKNTLKALGFSEESTDPVILKNTPEVCAQLWKIKHLIKVLPVKMPEKLPDLNDDLTGTYLHENGTFYVTPKIDPLRCQATKHFLNDPKRLDRETVKEKLRLQWVKGNPIY